MLYIKQQDPVSQRLAGWCYGNDILTRQYSTSYTDLPETWLESTGRYFLNLSLDFLVTLWHSVWYPTHCETRKRPELDEMRVYSKERCVDHIITNRIFDVLRT